MCIDLCLLVCLYHRVAGFYAQNLVAVVLNPFIAADRRHLYVFVRGPLVVSVESKHRDSYIIEPMWGLLIKLLSQTKALLQFTL